MIFNFDLSDVPNLAWGRGTEIPENADLDDYVVPGVYSSPNVTTSASIINAPYTLGNFKLIVAASGATDISAYTIQIVMSGSSMARHNFALRANANGVWTPWRRYITEDDFYYEADDTASFSSYIVASGLVRDSSKTIAFTVYTDKSMKNISTVTVTAMSGYFRCTNGFVDTSSSTNFITASGYTVTAEKKSDHAVTIFIAKSSAYTEASGGATVTNNSLACFNGSITLKFT